MRIFVYFFLSLSLFFKISYSADEIFTKNQKDAIFKLIDEHLTQNPEILSTVLQKLQEKQMQAQLEKNKETIEKHASDIFKSPNDFMIGNSKGTAVFAVFMDPYCSHCRKFHDTLFRALDTKTNPDLKNLKIIFKDFPIFGESSELAVKAMLAAKMQGKYLEFQKIMFQEEKPVTLIEIKKIASSLGLNSDRLVKDMNSDKVKNTIESTKNLANLLEINGTPSIIFDDAVLSGELTLDEIKKIVTEQDQGEDKGSQE